MSTNYIDQMTDTSGTTHDISEGDSTRIFRATCSTSASTTAKVATLQTSNKNFSLTAGVRVAVTFTYGNTATTPTLRVDGSATGTAKTIAIASSATAKTTGNGTTYNTWGPYETVLFTYDGTYWVNGGSSRSIYNAYMQASSAGSGTVTSVGIENGGGLSISGSPVTTSGSITVGHSNSVTAQTTQAVYPIKIDAQGHISAYGSAVTIPTVPTNVSAFTNDAGYITGYTETDPTVPSWAKASSKPTYTASEVGAAASSHAHGNITSGGDITATAPTIASGDQIIINDNSASKITNGPTFDGSTTTTALTPKGTWETFLKSYTETDPTVPSWAKASSKPSYTASEVGALPSSTSILSTSPTLSSTGLSPYSSRVSILKGGVYKFGKWRFVQLDLLVASSLSANNFWNILEGFDVPITDYAALSASVRGQNNGLLSAYINSSGNLIVETDDAALSTNWYLEITGWYIAS